MAKKTNNTKKLTGKPQIVHEDIIIKAPNRSVQDVGAWRSALRSADVGRPKLLFDLFNDLLIDGLLADAVEKRILAVLNTPLTFQNVDGTEVPEIMELIDTIAFEELLRTIMNSIMWGRAGGEFSFGEKFEFTEIPAQHISIETGSILINATDATGIPYAEDDHLLVLGRKNDFGLLLKTAPYAIWKRGGFGDYAQWLELFGMPQRVGKYSSYDTQSRKLLEEAMEKMGSAPYIIVPKESDIETTNNTGTGGASSAHNEFRRACNEEILITLLGQTLTTTQNDTGARSLGEVHKEVQDDKARADMRMVLRVLNNDVWELLGKRGYPVANGQFVFPESGEQLSVSDIVQLSDILPIPQVYLHEKYNIPAPEVGEAIARRQAFFPFPEEIPENGEGEDGEKSQKKEKKETKEALSLLDRLRRFFVTAPAGAGAGNHLTAPNELDELNSELFTDRIIRHAIEQGGLMPELFDFISADLISALQTKGLQLADLGFRYGYESDAFRTAQELNIFQFSAAKSIAEVQRLNELYRDARSFSEFHKKASQEVNVFNERWQRTEWETAGLINAATDTFNRLSDKTNLFPFWEYRTVGDDKVRAEHRDLNGIILPADDPLWQKIYPPNGWKCRCYVVPRMRHEANAAKVAESRQLAAAFFETKEWERAKASGFGVNRAAAPEVFAENQQYIAKFPNNAAKWLKDVNWRSHGLDSFEKMRAAAGTAAPQYAGNAADWAAGLPKENGRSFLTDYRERRIAVNPTALGDVRLSKAAAETLRAPAEVWINPQQDVYRTTAAAMKKWSGSRKGTPVNRFSQYVFLKYYSDRTIAVIANIAGGTVYDVATWFEVKESAATMNAWRAGLLIKKP